MGPIDLSGHDLRSQPDQSTAACSQATPNPGTVEATTTRVQSIESQSIEEQSIGGESIEEQSIGTQVIEEQASGKNAKAFPVMTIEPATGGETTPVADSLSTGLYACDCIGKHCRRLGRLQPDVLADTDPESLHQLRVTLRRLRSVFKLFGPALRLPEGVSEARLASVARRTSLTRDLDVLHVRITSELAPALSTKEQRLLARALKQLERDREQAFSTLVEAITGRRYLKLLARLGRWVRDPQTTPQGLLPLKPWASEWLAPILAGVFLEDGWFCQDPHGESLHSLRKRLKAVRYALESLQPLLTPPLLAWLDSLKTAQDHLGDIHDLQVLAQGFQGHGSQAWTSQPLPELRAALDARQQDHCHRWLQLREELTRPARRQAIHQALGGLGQSPDQAQRET